MSERHAGMSGEIIISYAKAFYDRALSSLLVISSLVCRSYILTKFGPYHAKQYHRRGLFLFQFRHTRWFSSYT